MHVQACVYMCLCMCVRDTAVVCMCACVCVCVCVYMSHASPVACGARTVPGTANRPPDPPPVCVCVVPPSPENSDGVDAACVAPPALAAPAARCVPCAAANPNIPNAGADAAALGAEAGWAVVVVPNAGATLDEPNTPKPAAPPVPLPKIPPLVLPPVMPNAGAFGAPPSAGVVVPNPPPKAGSVLVAAAAPLAAVLAAGKNKPPVLAALAVAAAANAGVDAAVAGGVGAPNKGAGEDEPVLSEKAFVAVVVVVGCVVPHDEPLKRPPPARHDTRGAHTQAHA